MVHPTSPHAAMISRLKSCIIVITIASLILVVAILGTLSANAPLRDILPFVEPRTCRQVLDWDRQAQRHTRNTWQIIFDAGPTMEWTTEDYETVLAEIDATLGWLEASDPPEGALLLKQRYIVSLTSLRSIYVSAHEGDIVVDNEFRSIVTGYLYVMTDYVTTESAGCT